jgi:hypothetical protein
MVGRFVVGAEQGAARSRGAVPLVGLGCCLLGELVCGLKVRDWVGFDGGGVRSVFGFEGPDVED